MDFIKFLSDERTIIIDSDKVINDLNLKLNQNLISKPNKWVYKLSCEQCNQYQDFNIEIEGVVTKHKFCMSNFVYVTNPKKACLYCNNNKANPSDWWILKFKIKKFWNNKKIKWEKFIL